MRITLPVDAKQGSTTQIRKLCSQCGHEYPGDATVCWRDGAELLSLPSEAGESHDALDTLPVGTILAGRFEILSLIGAGGMGIVYKARHLLLDRLVAIKMLHKKAVASSERRDLFQQEARTASLLSHPNIVHVLDFGIHEDRAFLVMDYVKGRSLDKILSAEGSIPLKRYFSVFSQAADALGHAHQKGVIHRDIKPSNMMLVEDEIDPNFLKLLDFGIAGVAPGRSDSHRTSDAAAEILGSPQYMSPEQCLGQAQDASSDVYSLGCVMYEALTGRPVHSGDSAPEIIYKHINDEPVPPRTVRPDLDIPRRVEEVVMRALAKEPQARFAGMSELARALEDAFRKNGRQQPEAKASAGKAGKRSLLFRTSGWLAAMAILSLIFVAVTADFSEALPAAWKSWRLQAKLLFAQLSGGAGNSALLKPLAELAARQEQRGDDIAAIRTRQRISMILKAESPGSLAEAEAKIALARLFERRNNAIRARTLRAEALTILRQLLAKDSVAPAERGLILERVLDQSQFLYGENSVEYAEALSDAAVFFAGAALWSKADQLFDRSQKVRQKVYGADSDKYAAALAHYGEACSRARNYTRAEPLLQQALSIRERLHGKESALVALSAQKLGALYLQMEKLAEAETQLIAAIASQGAVTGPESKEVVPMLNDLGRLYLVRQDTRQAQSMYQLAVNIEDRLSEPDQRQLAESLHGLGKAYAAQARLSDAEQAFMREIDARQRARDVTGEIAALKELASVLRGRSREARALEALRRADELSGQGAKP